MKIIVDKTDFGQLELVTDMAFEVRFKDEPLERLEREVKYNAGYSEAIVKAFRKRMQYIRAATDERDFFALNSLHFEKLKGNRCHQHSIRINDQWRLVLEFKGQGSTKIVTIVGIEDYH